MSSGLLMAGSCCEDIGPESGWCGECANALPNATVTVTGSCTDQDACDDAAGSYVFLAGGYTAETKLQAAHCTWALLLAGWGILYIVYYPRTEQVSAYIEYNLVQLFSDDGIEGVSCADDEITGSFSLSGNGGCSGCTANVTLT